MLEQAIAREPRLVRFLCHLFQRRTRSRLNLVTGAGISVDAGVPNWTGLLDRIASSKEDLATDVAEHRDAGLNPEYIGQIIFHRLRSEYSGDATGSRLVATIEHGWGAAIHEAIYKDVDEDIVTVLQSHPYLSALRDLTRQVPLVINFNFDDILADAVGDAVKKDMPGNAFAIAWQPPLTDRAGLTTIYHVNGILPRVALRKRSPQLIFTEDSFAEARARAPGVNAEYLFLRFVQNTMLLIGNSLGDSSLKNYLRLNRDKSPANHHYMIYWIKDDAAISESRRTDIFEANLELYNLITIFLTSSEIRDFLELLTLDDRRFAEKVDRLGRDRRSRFHYYIVGPVAAGKSTLLEQLRCFETQEEWTRPPPKEMYLAFDKLTEEQQRGVDRFLYEELREKNKRMVEAGIGFHFMDRAPLDLYAFSNSDAENVRKSEEIQQHVTYDRPLQKGEIIFIEASPAELVRRNMARGRPPASAGEDEYFRKQIDALRKVYDPGFVLSTEDCAAGEIAKSVARHVLFDTYEQKDLTEIVKRYGGSDGA